MSLEGASTFKRIAAVAVIVSALVALTAPAGAQANVRLTVGSPPSAVAVGSQVTWTSTNWRITAGSEVIGCASVVKHFEVAANGLSHVVLKPVGTFTIFNCALQGLGLPVTITDGTMTEELTTNTWGEGVSRVRFDFSIPSIGLNCELEGELTFQAIIESEGVEAGPSVLEGSGAGCASEVTMHAGFTQEQGTAPVVTDFVKTP